MSRLLFTRRHILGLGAAGLFSLLIPLPAEAAPTSRVVEIYEGKRGTTLKLELAEAPFPAKGSPWRDSTVLVFVPHHYRVRGSDVDVVLHFHGHGTTAEEAMKEHQLREQLYESRQNAILVMPQGPIRARSGDGGKLDDEGGLLRFLTDLRQTLQTREAGKALGASRLPRKARIGTVCISAHSGGYRVAARCITQGGYDVSEVYLFDALYGDHHLFREWVEDRKGSARKDRHKLISYYAGGRVAALNKTLMRELEHAGVPVLHEEREGTLTRAELTTARAVFVKTAVSHGNVTHQYNTLRDCLYASCLRRYLKSDWFDEKDKKRALERATPE